MKATHNPPTGEQDTPAVLLRCAALYLSRHGWHQGTYYGDTSTTDTPTPPACAVGAIGMAAAGRPLLHPVLLSSADEDTYHQAITALVGYLDAYQPIHFLDEDGFLADEHTSPYSWNDDPARTVGEVIKALLGAADEWEHHHMGGAE